MNRSTYQLEVCGLCRGRSGNGNPVNRCVACEGNGVVFVHQPPLHCPRCGGDGKANATDCAQYYSFLCIVCRGTGWVMTLALQEGSRLGRGHEHDCSGCDDGVII